MCCSIGDEQSSSKSLYGHSGWGTSHHIRWTFSRIWDFFQDQLATRSIYQQVYLCANTCSNLHEHNQLYLKKGGEKKSFLLLHYECFPTWV